MWQKAEKVGTEPPGPSGAVQEQTSAKGEFLVLLLVQTDLQKSQPEVQVSGVSLKAPVC